MKRKVKSTLYNVKKRFIELENGKIAEGLNSKSPPILIAALNALRKRRDPLYAFQAVKLLANFDEKVVVSALKYLAKVNHPLEENSIRALMDRGRGIKIQLASMLELLNKQVTCEMLVELLKDESTDVVLSALRVAPRFDCDEMLEVLMKVSNSQNMDVYVACTEVLYALGENVDYNKLSKIVFDVTLEDKLRKRALRTILENSSSPYNVIDKVLKSGDESLISTAFEFMGKHGLSCNKINDITTTQVSVQILLSLFKLLLKVKGDEVTLERLALAKKDHPSRRIRVLSFKILNEIESAYADEVLHSLLLSRDTEILRNIIRYVYRYPSKENLEILDTLLESSDERVVREVIKVYRRLSLKNEKILEHLKGVNPTSLKNEALRYGVELKLVSIETLESVINGEEDVKLKLTAVEGLAKLAPDKLEELEVA